ncbi:tyrosine--tRNA ligase [Enterococcus lactis]|uniref:tyrosine--tRNA ligase n=1 Tax=Enterococcus lactis TaxID=357441 RepID=UPI0022E2BA26|nr:tyrosine--tRNA ligase [Enterococcus lactis]
MNIIDELTWRDAINQQTNEERLRELVEEKSISLYCGVDPTGDSMHIGHLIPFMMMKRFQLAGHHPYILIGGGTGTIGDPSGRKTERVLQTMEQVQHNVDALSNQMRKLFGKDANITFVNNYDWLSKISLLEFLRDYGKNFNINTMLAKDIVASRLEVGLEGPEAEAFGLTIPLMLKADGTKFGKTAGGAVWLDPKKTSPFEFYQFWLNQLAKKVETEPEKREAQRRLAEEVTRFVHSEEDLKEAQKITQALFSGNIKELNAEEIAQGFGKMPNVEISSTPENIVELLVSTKIEPSKRQAREDVSNGAISINGDRVTDLNFVINPSDEFDGKFVVIRKGKKNYFLAKVID